MICCRDWPIFYFETKNQLCYYWHSLAQNQLETSRKIGLTDPQHLGLSSWVLVSKMIKNLILWLKSAFLAVWGYCVVGLLPFVKFVEINKFSVLLPIKYIVKFDFDWLIMVKFDFDWLISFNFVSDWLASLFPLIPKQIKVIDEITPRIG